MGLDFVELVMEVEDEFGIRINDADYEYMATVGDLQRLVLQKQGGYDDQPVRARRSSCQSLQTFLWLRATLRETLHVGELRLRPKDSLIGLLPQPDRRDLWESWRHRARLPLPSLNQPPVWDCVYLKSAVASAVVALSSLTILLAFLRPQGPLFHSLVIVYMATTTLTVAMLWFWKSGWPHLPPQGVATLGDLTRLIEPRHFEKLQIERSSSHAAWVLERVRQITSEQLGIPLADIHPHSRFVEDLGCG